MQTLSCMLMQGKILKLMSAGIEFLEGRLIKKGEEAVFVPGKTTVFIDGTANR